MGRILKTSVDISIENFIKINKIINFLDAENSQVQKIQNLWKIKIM